MLVLKKLIGGALLVVAIFVSSPLQAGDKDVNVTNDENSPIPVTISSSAQTIVEWRYVGYTTHSDNGSFKYGALHGITAMNKACADDFGAGARAATISEAFYMSSSADIQFQWLVPGGSVTVLLTPVDAKYAEFDAATGNQVGFLEPSAAEALVVAYCSRYTPDPVDRIAPVLTQSGEIGVAACNLELPVACSAPVAIPVTP